MITPQKKKTHTHIGKSQQKDGDKFNDLSFFFWSGCLVKIPMFTNQMGWNLVANLPKTPEALRNFAGANVEGQRRPWWPESGFLVTKLFANLPSDKLT